VGSVKLALDVLQNSSYIVAVSHVPSLPIEPPEPTAGSVTIVHETPAPEIQEDGLRFIGEPECIAKLFSAFATASATFGDVKKESSGQAGNQKFKYADLAAIMKVCRPKLSENGIVLIQAFGPSPRGETWMRATSVLAGHGAMIRTEFDFLTAKFMETQGGGIALQKLGVAQGYIRRMQAQALLGVAPDLDLDAPVVSDGPPPKQKQERPPAANTRRTTRAPAQKAAPAAKPAEKPKAQAKAAPQPAVSGEVVVPTPPKAVEPEAGTPEPIVENDPPNDDQKAQINGLVKRAKLAKLPLINAFVRKHIDPKISIAEIDTKQAATLIDLLEKLIAKNVLEEG